MKKPLVFIGGWLRGENSYRKLASIAPKGYKVLIVPHTVLDLNDIVGSLRKFIVKNKLIKVNLVGHSVGGAIAIEYATISPKSLSALYLIDSEGIYGSENIVQLFVNFVKTRVNHGSKLFFKDLGSFFSLLINPLFHFKLARHGHFADLNSMLGNINIPTVILWGEYDHVTPLWQAKEIKKRISGSKLVILPGMDHDWILHNPQLFWENYEKEY